MIKILTNTPPADNGNKFLCETCSNAHIRSGTHSQKEICCDNMGGPWAKVKFRVTQCSDHTPKSAFQDKAVMAMKSQAYILSNSREGRGMTFIPNEEAERRGLI